MNQSPLTTQKGICGICPAGCWVEVGLRDGKLETIGPNDSHSLGMICRRGEHAPEIIYSENRLRYPMRRKGPKGSTRRSPKPALSLKSFNATLFTVGKTLPASKKTPPWSNL